MADVTFEVYVDGALTTEEIHFWEPTHPDLPQFDVTVGGVLSLTDPDGVYDSLVPVAQPGYSWMTNPNVWPGAKVAGQLGVTPELDGGNAAYAQRFVAAGSPYVESDEFGWHYYDTKYRFFFRKFRLEIKWSDSTALVGRWVGLGYEESILPTPPGAGDLSDLIRIQRAYKGKSYDEETDHQLTDGDGIATYYGLLGIAVGVADSGAYGGYTWTLYKPPDYPVELGGHSHQNLAMATNQQEVHPYTGNPSSGTPYPYAIDESYYYRQWKPQTEIEKTPGWSIDYATAWDSVTGLLACPAPALVTHTYHQYGRVYVRDTDGSLVAATITIGAFSGNTGDLIAAVPKGSLLDGVRWQPTDTPETVPPITELPLLDASGYPATSTEGEETHLIPPVYYTTDGVEEPPFSQRPFTYYVSHDGKTANALQNVEGAPTDRDNWPSLHRGLFHGGEVLTQHYDGTWTETGGALRSGTFKIWIHEDFIEERNIWIDPDTAPADRLDYCIAPDGGAWLTEARDHDVRQWHSSNREAAVFAQVILDEELSSPSRLIRPDHRHLLIGIQSGEVKLWESPDGIEFTLTGTVDAANTYAGCVLRNDPAGTLHAWLITDLGLVRVKHSEDGGATWETLVTPTGFPTPPATAPLAARADFRHVDGRWHALAALDDGSIRLYSSDEGETWAEELNAATGKAPWLWPLSDMTFLMLYQDSGIYSRRISQDGSGWEASAAVAVLAGDYRGPVCYGDLQKALAVAQNADDHLIWRKTRDQGDTWEVGRFG